ncbi:hypothetical protein FB567DRAFT_106508 [Paraphoma chrysanthemicola]|uniref:Uncharacterized protein n=1 Tax=Paraphoma chrysanthemicola TaxID=798071 RepID=A0A8K0R1L1_9PLEO|nr:hypothetical protein FB567DRAFT_106508 [Paraphoma chrysanthemicola]
MFCKIVCIMRNWCKSSGLKGHWMSSIGRLGVFASTGLICLCGQCIAATLTWLALSVLRPVSLSQPPTPLPASRPPSATHLPCSHLLFRAICHSNSFTNRRTARRGSDGDEQLPSSLPNRQAKQHVTRQKTELASVSFLAAAPRSMAVSWASHTM